MTLKQRTSSSIRLNNSYNNNLILKMSQKIRIKLKSYDHQLVDKSAEKIVKAVKATGAIVSGPIPLPTHKRIFTVNRSTFVNKKSREQFQLSDFKRLIDIYSSTAKTVDEARTPQRRRSGDQSLIPRAAITNQTNPINNILLKKCQD